jgi:DNA-binding transcriptional LysR family regulator
MRHSPEALLAFAEAAALGSFSAAARKLGKRQSTISEAIGNLEIDLGLTLFDRSTRQPTLTEAGHAMLTQVRRVLDASEQMDRLAAQMAGGLEARLTLVVSDTYQSDRYEQTLAALEQRFPELELECLIAEHEDVVRTARSSGWSRRSRRIRLISARPPSPSNRRSGCLSAGSTPSRNTATPRCRTPRCARHANCGSIPSSIRPARASRGRT